MSMHNGSPPTRPRVRSAVRSSLRRLLPAGLLGVAAALLVSCASSGNGLIPAEKAGPLQSDFEAVEQAAQNGDGSCAATEAAISKTELDFNALPATVDQGLRNRLAEGISKLHADALQLCAQPLSQVNTATSSLRSTTITTSTSATTPATTPTSAETTPATGPTSSGPAGGTSAPPNEIPPGSEAGPGGSTGSGSTGATGVESTGASGPTGAGQ
jgi:hypothetical protein